MKNETVIKVGITVVTVLSFVLLPVVGYGCNDIATYQTVLEHLLFPFSHANVWHLAGNLFVLWVIRGRLHILEALAIGFVASWVPVLPGVWDIIPLEMQRTQEAVVTMGLSGVLFAIIGIKWGIYCARYCCQGLTTLGVKVLPFVMMGALIPNVNWSLHLYCLLLGLVVGVMESRCKRRSIQG